MRVKESLESYNLLQGSPEFTRLSKPYKLIFKCLEENSVSITPKEIANSTKLNDSSVRVYLRNLVKDPYWKNIIANPDHGYYILVKNLVTFEPMGSKGFVNSNDVLPRLHNLHLHGRYEGEVRPKKIIDLDVVQLKFRWFKNGYVSVNMKTPKKDSLDLVGWKIIKRIILDEAGFQDEVSVKGFDFNVDYAGSGLKGCSELTLRAFDGSFERLYNVDGGLRSEVHISGSTSPETIYTLLKGGVSAYNSFQSQFLLCQKVDNLVKAVKFGNGQIVRCARLMSAFLERLPIQDAFP